MVLHNIRFQLHFFWRSVRGKRAPDINWTEKSGRDWIWWPKYSWPNSNPGSRTVSTLTGKKKCIIDKKKKKKEEERGCEGFWTLLTDTKINKFRIITFIFVVNGASNLQNWITLRQWSKNAPFYRIHYCDSFLSPASTALLERNLSKQHPETAAQNTVRSDVFC